MVHLSHFCMNLINLLHPLCFITTRKELSFSNGVFLQCLAHVFCGHGANVFMDLKDQCLVSKEIRILVAQYLEGHFFTSIIVENRQTIKKILRTIA